MSTQVAVTLDTDSHIEANTHTDHNGRWVSLRIGGVSVHFSGYGNDQAGAARRLLAEVQKAVAHIATESDPAKEVRAALDGAANSAMRAALLFRRNYECVPPYVDESEPLNQQVR